MLMFMYAFHQQMSHNFSEVFKQLVSHGKATLVMKTDPVEQTVKRHVSNNWCGKELKKLHHSFCNKL